MPHSFDGRAESPAGVETTAVTASPDSLSAAAMPFTTTWLDGNG